MPATWLGRCMRSAGPGSVAVKRGVGHRSGEQAGSVQLRRTTIQPTVCMCVVQRTGIIRGTRRWNGRIPATRFGACIPAAAPPPPPPLQGKPMRYTNAPRTYVVSTKQIVLKQEA